MRDFGMHSLRPPLAWHQTSTTRCLYASQFSAGEPSAVVRCNDRAVDHSTANCVLVIAASAARYDATGAREEMMQALEQMKLW